MGLMIPVGYGRRLMDIDEAWDRYGAGMHPEYRHRIFAYLRSKDGLMGIGSAWRRTPHNVSAASRAGHSFHQTQTFASGVRAFCAIDAVCRNGSNVHRAPRWSEVPKQGSGHPDIDRYGIHANIRSETWHLQPVEIDGYRSWVRAGRPDPKPRHQPPPPPQPQEDDDVLVALVRYRGKPGVYAQWSNGTKTWVPDPDTLDVYKFLGHTEIKDLPNPAWMKAAGPIVGPKPPNVDEYGVQ